MTEYSKIQYVSLHIQIVIYALGIIASALGLMQSIIYTFNNQSQLYWIIIFAILIVVSVLAWAHAIEQLSTMKYQKEVNNENI